jgi:ABC-type multidrug transport system fused ATPase/permease subunit
MAGDLTWFFRFSIESVVRILGITGYMLLRSPMLGACALSLAPFIAVINKLYGNWLAKNAAAVQDALAEANSVAQEALCNIRTVISFAAEQQENDAYSAKIQQQYTLNIRQLFMTGIYYMFVNTFMINTIVQGTLLYIGSVLIQEDKLTADVLLAFMLYQGQLQQETLNLFQSYSSLIKSSGAGDKVFELLDRKPPAPSINNLNVRAYNKGTEGNRCEAGFVSNHLYTVRLENIFFSYPSRPHVNVLENLSLTIPKGKTLALVGASGCGKSTVINLLQRFNDPIHGNVFVNGCNMKELDVLEYRRNIGVVTQNPVLFQGSLLDNILYGCAGATRNDAMRAAKMAHAHDFCLELGYDTLVGERGVQLSGGQQQRIAIARALVKNPSLLLLDEATSALDTASEQMVQQALDTVLQSRSVTTVVVAHRLQTVRNADVIVVLHGGRVVEKGTHEELVVIKDGYYRKMVDRANASGLLPEN